MRDRVHRYPPPVRRKSFGEPYVGRVNGSRKWRDGLTTAFVGIMVRGFVEVFWVASV